MAWTAPKTDWTAADGVADTHLNNIGNNLLHIKTDHMDLTIGVHGAVPDATANALMARDAYGRAKVVAPSATDDIAIKATVDAEGTARTDADTALQAQITAMGTGPFVPIAGGTMTGKLYAQANTDYTTCQVRNIKLMTTVPTVSDLAVGEVAFVYEV